MTNWACSPTPSPCSQNRSAPTLRFRLDLLVSFNAYRQGMTAMQISELSRRSGVPASTLRYYGQIGLLPADRTAC
ncbi:MerR family transcriptional regulator [Mycobacterium antarcticum]